MMKFSCRIAAFLLCTALLLSVAAAGFMGWAEETEPVAQDVMTKEEAAALVENKDDAYIAICNAVRNRQSTVDLSGCKKTAEQLSQLMQQMIFDHPEFFYLNTGYSYSVDQERQVTTVYLKYRYEGQELIDAIAEYEALFGALAALGSEEWSDLETVLFYHDYLAAHYQYDLDLSIYDAYGFLKNGEGVCQAYTLVFDALMTYYDIPCTFAQSTNLAHIWNVVFVDGGWYYLDVTWDDPVVSNDSSNVDRPGSARHSYFLLSASEDLDAHFTKKGEDCDRVLGADITVSATSHRYSSIWKYSTAPFVAADGHFYGITVTADENGNASGARFVEVNFEKGGQVTGYATLSVYWFCPGGSSSAYLGNYSGLCTDGRYVYYSTDSSVYKYDSLNGSISSVSVENIDTNEKKIYSLRFEQGELVAYLCDTPAGPFEAVTLKNEQTLYTITWVVDGDSFALPVAAGTMPVFQGSTYKEGENGISYQFIGWDPMVELAYGDATYTAVYAVIKEYVPGDVNGDGDVSISDVTALLNYLASPDTAEVNLSAVDPDADGGTSISDVTLLLNFIAGHDVELN